MTMISEYQPRTPRETKAQAGTPSGADTPPAAPDGEISRDCCAKCFYSTNLFDDGRLFCDWKYPPAVEHLILTLMGERGLSGDYDALQLHSLFPVENNHLCSAYLEIPF